MEYYSAIKNEIMPSAATWMDLEIIILSQTSQKEKETPHDSTYTWNLKYNKNEYMYEAEADSQTQRTNMWVPRQGVGEREGLGVGD